MATSSITHNFVLTERESIEGFIQAIEEAEIDNEQREASNVSYDRLLTDSKEITKLMSKIK